MPFPDPWNTTYEGVPADTEDTNIGANRIRDFKTNVRARVNIDHSFGDTADNGQHNQTTYNTASGDPSPSVANSGILYTKVVGGIAELFFKNGGGAVQQVTTNGALNVPQAFPTGTVMIFYNTVPPVGWVQVNLNDYTIRITNGVGTGGGGSWLVSGLTASTSVSTGTSTSVFDTGSFVGSHALTVGELPPHQHDMFANKVALAAGQTGGSFTVLIGTGNPSDNLFLGPSGNGTEHGIGGFGHNHPISLALGASSSSSSSASTSISSNGSWRPQYLNCVLGQKS